MGTGTESPGLPSPTPSPSWTHEKVHMDSMLLQRRNFYEHRFLLTHDRSL